MNIGEARETGRHLGMLLRKPNKELHETQMCAMLSAQLYKAVMESPAQMLDQVLAAVAGPKEEK